MFALSWIKNVFWALHKNNVSFQEQSIKNIKWNKTIKYLNFYRVFNLRQIIQNYSNQCLYINLLAKPTLSNVITDFNMKKYLCNQCNYSDWTSFQTNNNIRQKIGSVFFAGTIWYYKENNLNILFNNPKNPNKLNKSGIVKTHLLNFIVVTKN